MKSWKRKKRVSEKMENLRKEKAMENALACKFGYRIYDKAEEASRVSRERVQTVIGKIEQNGIEMPVEEIRAFADEIYNWCVKKRMTRSDYRLLILQMEKRRVRADAASNRIVDKLQLPNREELDD